MLLGQALTWLIKYMQAHMRDRHSFVVYHPLVVKILHCRPQCNVWASDKPSCTWIIFHVSLVHAPTSNPEQQKTTQYNTQ